MKVEVFAAQIHVEDLVVAYIEQNLTMCNAKLEWAGDERPPRSENLWKKNSFFIPSPGEDIK